MTTRPVDGCARALQGAGRWPLALVDAGVPAWETLIRQAKASNLIGRLAAQADAAGTLGAVPAPMRWHFDVPLAVSRIQHIDVRSEAAHLMAALGPLGVPVVFLKGAAYVMAGLPPAIGRTFGDTDLLVPHAAIDAAEAALLSAGWVGDPDLDPYDQRYYREWMHEIPPLEHRGRGTVVDLHHNILPRTARFQPSGAALVEAAVPVRGLPGAFVLSPPDMVLHSMTHLLVNDDLSHGQRDLSDLDLLLRHFGAQPGFWDRLVERAALLDLDVILAHGLWATSTLMATPQPAGLAEAADRRAVTGGPAGALVRWAWGHGLSSPLPATRRRGHRLAMWLLATRAHLLRMPPGLLARHLARKSWMRLQERRMPAA